MSVRVRDKDHGFKKRTAILHHAAKKGELTIGIHAAKASVSDGKTTVLQVAIWNEFGTSRIPARSFLRAWFDENEELAHKRLSMMMRKVAQGKITEDKALEILGLWIVGAIQGRISAGIDPENAASTVARKGSSKPLIDKGILRSSVTFKVN